FTQRRCPPRSPRFPYTTLFRSAADVCDAIVQAITPRTRIFVVDHVTAQTALVLPVAAIAAACRARGVPVLVDGAHAPGARELNRSEEHTSELQSLRHLVCRLLL